MLEKIVQESVETEKQAAFYLNEYIYNNPELPYKEFLACEKYVEMLKQQGIEVEENYLGFPTAFKATIHEDPTSDIKIGILAEYDALPEIGHACGHSASGALSFLAAVALYRNSADLKGNIYLIGTPAEEFNGIKTDLAESGQFDDFTFVIMIHMYDRNRSYSVFTALSGYTYEFSGSPAHAAAVPWEGKNAVNGMMLFIHALDMMRQQLRDGTRIHGIILKGGTATNVIPDQAVCQYLFRYETQDYLKEVIRMAQDAAEGCARATQTTVKITAPGRLLANMKNIPSGSKVIADIYTELGVELDTGPNTPLGSSDIGNLSYRCPAFHPMISVADGDERLPIHTREFALCMAGEKTKWAIEKGAKTIATFIVRALHDEELRRSIKKDFAERK